MHALKKDFKQAAINKVSTIICMAFVSTCFTKIRGEIWFSWVVFSQRCPLTMIFGCVKSFVFMIIDHSLTLLMLMPDYRRLGYACAMIVYISWCWHSLKNYFVELLATIVLQNICEPAFKASFSSIAIVDHDDCQQLSAQIGRQYRSWALA